MLIRENLRGYAPKCLARIIPTFQGYFYMRLHENGSLQEFSGTEFWKFKISGTAFLRFSFQLPRYCILEASPRKIGSMLSRKFWGKKFHYKKFFVSKLF